MARAILVVEDTELLRRIYTDKLAQDGYDVHGAADGLEALSYLRTNTPDLILLDLIMPKMSGLEVLEVIKKDPRLREIPVVILTNLGQDSDVERGLSMGALDYLIKNEAKPADVAEKIKATLDLVSPPPAASSFKLLLRDREGDTDRLVEHLGLPRRFWCPACEVELTLELIPKKDKHGWFDAHFICQSCGREF